jgi:hypothetical protein
MPLPDFLPHTHVPKIHRLAGRDWWRERKCLKPLAIGAAVAPGDWSSELYTSCTGCTRDRAEYKRL